MKYSEPIGEMSKCIWYGILRERMPELQQQLDQERSRKRINADTVVYRYMKLKHFIDMVENRYYAFAHISQWDDPFEGLVFRAVKPWFKNDHHACDELMSLYSNCYGQSWTLEKEDSDLFWRAYCFGEYGVRIKTTVGVLAKLKPSYSLDSVLLNGMVMYNDRYAMKKQDGFDATIVKLAKSLFVKRRHFKQEKEYRLIGFVGPNDREWIRNGRSVFRSSPSLLRGPVGENFWKSIGSEVLADPHMSKQEMDCLRCRVKKAGFNFKVKQSKIYQPPDIDKFARKMFK